jgi:hypothetical protein
MFLSYLNPFGSVLLLKSAVLGDRVDFAEIGDSDDSAIAE